MSTVNGLGSRRRTSLLQQVFLEFGAVPRSAVAWAVCASVLSEVFDVVCRNKGSSFSIMDVVALGVTVPIWLFASYAASMLLIKHDISFLGWLRYVLASLFAFVPLAVLLGGLWLLPKGGGSTALVTIGLVVIAAACLLIPLFVSWPVALAVSRYWVGPLRIFRATRGNRWNLLVAAYLTTALNKIVPAVSKAHNSGEVALLALGNLAVDCVTLLLASCIAVVAWKLACGNDPQLEWTPPNYG